MTTASLDELVDLHARLISLERESELSQASLDASLLTKRDARLVIVRLEHSSSLGGRTTALMKRRSDLPLALGRIAVGDVVALRPVHSATPSNSLAALPRGVVSRLTDLAVTVVLDDSPDADADAALTSFEASENASVYLVRLANDVTFKRLKEALAVLPSLRATRVARVCFGDVEPRALGEALTAVFDGGLNASQIAAVQFALASSDVAVIHGPPGTGKTTTLVEVVRQLVARKRRVLVCAPSNTAVDNLLAKLAPCMARGELVLTRLGHAARISDALLPFALDNVLQRSDGMALVRDIHDEIGQISAQLSKARGAERRAIYGQLRVLRADARLRERTVKERTLAACDVVLCTCVGAGSKALRQLVQKFDVCIIDEAAQALELSCWLPISLCSRLILAGDHLQLPPTIFSDEAARAGLAVTLLERVVKRWGDGCTRLLTTQYRMHEKIMAFSNAQLYDGKLVAHSSVAQHELVGLAGVSNRDDDDDDAAAAETYEARTLAPLLLIDTAGCDMYEALESSNDDAEDEESKSNAGEAAVVAHHVARLVACGVAACDIGVLTPYNGQVRVLKELLLARFPALEIGSVDGFQGREKEAIVISFVRSNNSGNVGFLSDDRRTNVAITRARRHLALIGDTTTLSSHLFLKRLVAYAEEHGHTCSADELQVDDHWRSQQTIVNKAIAAPAKPKAAKQSNDGVSEAELAARNAQVRTRMENQIAAFARNARDGDVLRFPASLTSFERMVAHEVAEKHSLEHKSEGQGKERQIAIKLKPKELVIVEKVMQVVAAEEGKEEEEEEVVEDEDEEVEEAEEVEDEEEEDEDDEHEDEVGGEDAVEDADDVIEGDDVLRVDENVGAVPAVAESSSSSSTSTSASSSASSSTTRRKYPSKPSEGVQITSKMSTGEVLRKMTQANSRCNFSGCRASIEMFSKTCEFCKQIYCFSHALAMLHGCRDAAREKRRTEVQTQLKQIQTGKAPAPKVAPQEQARFEAKFARVQAEKAAARKPKPTKAEAARGGSTTAARGGTRGRGRGGPAKK
jgi:ATP-dependent RNA/DNA helicase IGHMBP2